MQLERAITSGRTKARFAIRIAKTKEDVCSAQRLRWSVFSEEQGARLDSPIPGLDIDAFDEHCEHLLVVDMETDEVIGTYRLLTAGAAQRCGGYYSQQEFDLDFLASGPRRLLEIGRSCVHPRHRNGATIALLWSGIAQYLVQSRHDALIGCASIQLGAARAPAAALARNLASANLSAAHTRVTPRRPLPDFGGAAPTDSTASVPPLLKGYLRSGAVVCGEPSWDPDFNTADLFIYLGLQHVEARYARRFLTA